MQVLLTHVARNSFFEAFGKLSIKVISFIFTIFIIRWLGDEDYGKYSLIWSYVVIFSLFSDAGLGLYAIREIAKKQSNSQYIAGNIIVMRLILALVATALIVVSVWMLGHSGDFLFQVFLASLILLLYAVQDPFDAVLQANERFDRSAGAIIAGLFVFVSVGIILLLFGWHITGIIIARLLNVVVSALLAWKLLAGYRRDLQWKILPRLWLGIIRVSLPFGLIKLWLNWSSRIGLIILAWFWTDQIVGWYGAAYNMLLGIIVLSSSINAAFYPALSRQYTQDQSLLPRIYEFALKYLLILSLPIAAFVSLLADKIVHLLYGAEFAPAAAALAIIVWIFPLVSISEFLRYVLLVINHEYVVVRIMVLGVLLNAALNLWLIPIYGFLAAAIVAFMVEFVLVFLYIRKLSFELKSVNLTSILLKPFLATMILLVIANTLLSDSPILQIILGSLIYIFLLLVFKVVRIGEFVQLFYSLKPILESPSDITINKKVKSGPLVSVFIPTYNAERFVAQAIESVLAQTYPNYELIIIDDDSTDGTANILKQYQSHPKVTVQCNPENAGMAANWNIGLELCRGELIAKLDADDFYEHNYLETVVNFFQKNKSVGLVFSGLNLIYPNGRCEPEMRYLRSWVRSRELFLPDLLESCIIRSPTVCVRRICYEQLGFFIEQLKLHADWEMWVRIATNYPVGFIARRLANYRTSYGSNRTAQAVKGGYSIQDLRLWLNLLEKEELPYQLSASELEQFRWGIYDLEMRFAGMAAYHHQKQIQNAYTVFAEEVLPNQPSTPEALEEMRWVYTNLHQGIYAFRENRFKEAGYYFLRTVKLKSGTPPQIWYKSLLTYKIIKRFMAGFYRYLIIKYQQI